MPGWAGAEERRRERSPLSDLCVAALSSSQTAGLSRHCLILVLSSHLPTQRTASRRFPQPAMDATCCVCPAVPEAAFMRSKLFWLRMLAVSMPAGLGKGTGGR